MATYKCPDCAKQVSEYASSCPNCGCPSDRLQPAITNQKREEKEKQEEYERFLNREREKKDLEKRLAENRLIECLNKGEVPTGGYANYKILDYSQRENVDGVLAKLAERTTDSEQINKIFELYWLSKSISIPRKVLENVARNPYANRDALRRVACRAKHDIELAKLLVSHKNFSHSIAKELERDASAEVFIFVRNNTGISRIKKKLGR